MILILISTLRHFLHSANINVEMNACSSQDVRLVDCGVWRFIRSRDREH